MPTTSQHLAIDPEAVQRSFRDLVRFHRPLTVSLEELEAVVMVQLERDIADVTEEEVEDVRRLVQELLPAWRQAVDRGDRPFGFPQELLTRYYDVEFIGEGGFGRVYRAHSRDGGRQVALKVLKTPEDRASRRMFITELEVWRGLSHRNIIEYYTEDTQPHFIEVEYADGGSLVEVEKPMPLESACDLLLKVSEGLLHAHGQNRTHGDIKPSNVLLTSAGQPKLSDWGLGRVLMDSPLSYTGGMSRNFAPYYAAPEHFNRGEPLGFKTDVYQLGVLGYELVTGGVPFPTDDYDELRRQILHDDPPRPSEADQRYAPIDEIILPCLAKSRDDRPELSEVRLWLAKFLGQSYSRSLQEFAVTRRTRNMLIAQASLATVLACQDEYSRCLSSLRDLEDGVKGTERRDLTDEIVDLVNTVEIYELQSVPMTELIERFEGVEHRVQTM